MSDLNQCNFIGRLGNDPEQRSMPNGNAVTSLSIAVGEQWKDKQTGQKQERTEWVRVTAFGKLAEIMGQYLNKGSQVYISGKIRTRKWQDKDTGADRYSTEIVADQMQMLGSKQPAQDGGYQNQQNPAYQQQGNEPNNQQQPAQQPVNNYDDSGSIPF